METECDWINRSSRLNFWKNILFCYNLKNHVSLRFSFSPTLLIAETIAVNFARLTVSYMSLVKINCLIFFEQIS